MTQPEPQLTCNHCGGEVRYDPNQPSYRCADPEHDCGMGRYVHTGRDCGQLRYGVEITEDAVRVVPNEVAAAYRLAIGRSDWWATA